jgi:tRNA U34 5-carboxymethylaminomethyl modifying GTPase MnmE/TrmE
MSTLYNNKYDILASTIQPNPASVKYWADLSSNPNGGDLKYFNGTKWILVNNKTTEDISQIKQQIADLEQNKEDKVEGKGLSTEDYTTQEKNKLTSLQNYNDSEVRKLISALNLRLTTLSEDLESLKARVAALETLAA